MVLRMIQTPGGHGHEQTNPGELVVSNCFSILDHWVIDGDVVGGMRHARDTHVLVDGTGTAVMSGTLEQMETEAIALAEEGVRNISIRTIDDAGHWDWTMVDWGDD